MILILCFELTTEEFNELIQSTFNFSFDIRRATGMPPKTTLEYIPTKLTDKDPIALLERADSIRSGKRCRDVGLLLRVLVTDNVLPEGTFRIRDGERPRVAGVWQRGTHRIKGVLTCI